MKKILIGILIILFITLIAVTLIKGISIFGFKIPSIKDMKNKSDNLDNLFTTANDLTKKTYPTKLEEINSAIKALSIEKEKYEAKTKNMTDETTLGVVQTKSYKVEFLWVTIENYAKKEGLVLKMDIEDGSNNSSSILSNNNLKQIYSLNFTITGDYIGITDFIYDIENDENLEFEIKELIITPKGATTNSTATNETTNKLANTTTSNTTTNSSKNNTTNTNTTNNTEKKEKDLEATFKVENIEIEF